MRTRLLCTVFTVLATILPFFATTTAVAKQDVNVAKDPDGGGGDDESCEENNCACAFVYVFEGDTELQSSYNGCRTDADDCSKNDDGDSCSKHCAPETCFERYGDAAVYWSDIVRGGCSAETGELADGEDIHLGYSIDPDRDVKCSGFWDCCVDCNLDWGCGSGAGSALEPLEFVNTHIVYNGTTAQVTMVNNALPQRTLQVSNYRYDLALEPYQLAELNESLDPALTPLAGSATLVFGAEVTVDIPLPSGFEHAYVVFARDVFDPGTGSSAVAWTQFHPAAPPVPTFSEWGIVALFLLLAAGIIILKRRASEVPSMGV